MAVITIRELHKSFGAEVIFDSLGLILHRKEKVGLVGANGSGKTTLFKLIAGFEDYDIGEVVRKKDIGIGYLPQEPLFEGERTVLEEVHSECELILKLERKIEKLSERMSEVGGSELESVMREYDRLCHEFEIAGGYEYESRVKAILAGVGIDESLYGVRTNELSGGQKSRLGLAKVLLGEAELLLLDEPTNHLDLAGREWLEKFIFGYDGAAVIISHDRYLLDRVASKIIEVKNRGVKVWKGNYTRFIEESAKQKLAEQREYEKRSEFVKKELDFIARNKNLKGMQGTARGRNTRLERLLAEQPDYLEKSVEGRSADFGFENLKKKSNIVLRCEDLGKRYGELVLFEGLSFEMYSGERLGIIGPNGTGKSSLIKMAIGQVEASSGSVRMGKSLKAGYLDQQGSELDSELTVLEEASRVRPEWEKGKVRGVLGAFLFSGDDAFKKVGNLSGGEQNRLALCKLVMGRPEVLILDEPTNHLDIATKEVLERALRNYDGAVIVVSHDRYFLDQVVDKLLIIGADEFGQKEMGRFEFIDGGYSEYAKLIEKREQNKVESKVKSGGGKRKRSKREKERKTTPKELKKFNTWEIEQVEEEIEKLEVEIAGLEERFGEEGIYKDTEKYEQLQKDYEGKKCEVDLLYRAYEWKLGK